MDDNDEFTKNLLRAICAQLFSLNAMTVSREMFGKSYFSLGPAEKAAVDQTALLHTGSNYNMLTPDYLGGQQQPQQPMGFAPQAPSPDKG